MKKKQQIRAIKNAAKTAQTKSKKISFYKNAAKNLQNYSIGSNRVTEIQDIIGDRFDRIRNLYSRR